MSEHGELYPHASRELNEQRNRLAPDQAEAFRTFSQRVFADGVVPIAHSALALDAIVHEQAER